MSGVLVSGATQPLGRRVLERLLEGGYGPLVALGAEPTDQVAGLLPEGVRYFQVDLTRPRRVRRLLFGPCRALAIESVIHLAFHRDPGGGARAHRLHVAGTRLMLRLAEEHPSIHRFLHRSSSSVYANRSDAPDVLREDQPVNLDPQAPQWVRDRVEADVTVCARMGLSALHINVLRCAEILAPDMGSQLHDYLGSRVCLRPAGFDPMVEVLSLDDAARAFVLALDCPVPGIINIPGRDTLPLSKAITLWGRRAVPLPGPVLGPLYRLRALTRGTDFRYDMNARRFHFNGILDGDRAKRDLSYTPSTSVSWPAAPDAGSRA